MAQPKIRTPYNSEEFKRDDEKNFAPSKVEPNQAMTVKEILSRFAAGLPVGGGKVPIYEGDEGYFSDVKMEKLDLAEREDVLRKAKAELQEVKKRIQEKHSARRWNEMMYGRQRQDSLADWTMMNEYNSPQEQMKRFQEAKLNPHLIYGQQNEGATVRSTDVKSWNPQAPEVDLGYAANTGLSAYFDSQVKQATADNLKMQNTVLQQEALLKTAQIIGNLASTGKTYQDTATAKFDLEMKQELKEISLQSAQAILDKTKAETKSTLDENERRAAMQQPNLLKAAEEVLTMRANRAKTASEKAEIEQRIKNLKLDERLKQLDIDLRKLGIQPGDSMWSRMLARIINEADKLPLIPGQEVRREAELTGETGWEKWKKTAEVVY